MTEPQFEALCKLNRAHRKSRSCLAARLVLVEGESNKDAAELFGIEPKSVWMAVKRLLDAYKLAKIVVG